MLEQTGISFPFRVGIRGGVALSTTSIHRATHIEEDMQQLLLTNRWERAMRPEFFGDLNSRIFSLSDESTKTLLRKQIKDALLQDSRIEVRDSDIDIDMKENRVFATIRYKVLMYENYYQTTFEI